MSKKFTRFLTLSGSLLLATALIGCGGSENPTKDPTKDPTPTVDPSEPSVTPTSTPTVGPTNPTPTVPPTASKTVEISFWHTFGQTIQDVLNKQIAKFQKAILVNEGVNVEIKLVPNSNYDTIKDEISKGLVAGNIPTLAVAYPDHVAEYMYAEGGEDGKYVVNLGDFVTNEEYGLGTDPYLGDRNKDSVDDFISAFIDEGTHFIREGLYTFPYMKSTEVMLYNYDAVELVMEDYHPEYQGSKAKIKQYMDNLNWEEFMNLCRQVESHKDKINKDLKKPAFYDSDSNLFITQMFQTGTPYSSVIEKDGKKVGHIDFDTGTARADAEQLVTNLRSWYKEGLFTTKGAYSTYGSDSFKNKETVFTIGSSGGSGYSLTTDFNLGVCKVPTLNNTVSYVEQGPDLIIMNNPGLSTQANADKQLYAWKLLKFLTNPTNNCEICLKGSEGYSPVRYSAYEEELYLDFMDSGEFQAEIAECITNKIQGRFYTTACFKGSSQLRTEVGGIITEALTNEKASITDIFSTAINNATMYIN